MVLKPVGAGKKRHGMNFENVFREMSKYPSSAPPTHRTQSTSQQEHLFFTLQKPKSVTEKAKAILTVKMGFFPITYKVAEERILKMKGELYHELYN